MPKKNTPTDTSQQITLPFLSENAEHLNISTLETWLLDAANTIRGASDAPKFKDFILPLIFYKRLSDVFDDEFAKQIDEYGDEESAREIIAADHEDALKTGRNPIVRFYIPQQYGWETLRNQSADGHLGEFVTKAMREVARLNPRLEGVLNVQDFNETQSGQRTLDEDRLEALIEVLSRYRLGLQDTEPDILGRAYEYLLRKFAEGQGQSAGEFYTPKEVGWLMARLINPEPYTTIYDPACGSGGLLIKGRLLFEQTHPDEKSQAPQIYGQELTPTTYAMAKMNAFLHDFIGADIQIGDTFRNPGFSRIMLRYNVLTMCWRIQCGIRRSMMTLFMQTIVGNDLRTASHRIHQRIGRGCSTCLLLLRTMDVPRLCWILAQSLAGRGVSRPVANAIFAKSLLKTI